MKNTNTKPISLFDSLGAGQTVYFSMTEELPWDKPFPMKRHHIYDTRTVILKGELIHKQGDQFKVRLFGNNAFERDEQSFVFHKGCLLCNQEFKDSERLGQWKNNPTNYKP